MEKRIEKVNKNEYQEVVNVWESSVRSTHHFLKEEDIEYYKTLILSTYLDAVELRCIRNSEDNIVGFLGTADHNLEMLFIAPEYIGKGIGKTLLVYSINQLNVNKVDVNEENEQAIGFYKHFGFEVIGRSALDSSGKPYPTLHMALK
ncbi:GNAT family N-acetyltransferase [Membranihabitans marinus]|uniref:GNAT family N-acetyltransferase n=1 Tax=Membranihabitans marinus TaxID=1227546 RepID=UPI001F02ED04|nr:GNAT family N-acetyltransferase [Membranihabitans marinus]